MLRYGDPSDVINLEGEGVKTPCLTTGGGKQVMLSFKNVCTANYLIFRFHLTCDDINVDAKPMALA